MNPSRWLDVAPGAPLSITPFDGSLQTVTVDRSTPRAPGHRVGVAIDCETNGLNPATDKVIEIGLRAFLISPTCEFLGVVYQYDGLQDPGAPLPERIRELTGLDDAMLAGQSIDATTVANVLRRADFVVAHNAAFDRPFVDRFLARHERAVRVRWACSMEMVDWKGHGLPGVSLEVLCALHGFYGTSHRAGADAASLVRLLAHQNAEAGETYLAELCREMAAPAVLVTAHRSPFETKDVLKERGYSWSPAQKVWSRVLSAADRATEMDWLDEHVYRGVNGALWDEIDPMARYSFEAGR